MIDWPEIVEYLSKKGHGEMGVRPIREGRALLKSGVGLVAVVNRQKDDDLLPVIEAHCMRCKVNETPHKIDITFKNINCQELGDFMEVEQAECSCTAASGTCKHIVATLMYLEKTGIDHIDTELSPTDLKQKWGQCKEMYTPIPLKNFCCNKEEQIVRNINELVEKKANFSVESISNCILAVFPNSAFKLQKDGRRSVESVQSLQSVPEVSENIFPIDVEVLVTSENASITTAAVDIFPIQNTNLSSYFEKYIKVDSQEAVQIFRNTIGQNNIEWQMQRQARITGSVAHGFLTYSRNKANKPRDWDKKIGSSIFQKFSGTADMKYGVENEPIALALFQKQNPDSEIVTGAGIIVNEKCPWFAYSPDGFEITIDNEFYLLEVKCPSNGKEFGNAEQLSKTSFLKYDEENHTFYLRNPNRYYTQVQLGLMLMNIKKCKLLIYSEKTRFVQDIIVLYDEPFCTSLFVDLTKTYFNIFLPFYYENRDRMLISKNDYKHTTD